MSDGIESQHLRRLMVRAREAREARMTDDVSKPALGDGIPSLPEWPEKPSNEGSHPADEWHIHWMDTASAALARMEALVEYAQHEDGCRAWNPTEDYGHWDLSCNCGLDALLAACERRSER